MTKVDEKSLTYSLNDIYRFCREFLPAETVLTPETNLADGEIARRIDDEIGPFFLDEFFEKFGISCKRFEPPKHRIPVLGYLYWRLWRYPSIEIKTLTVVDLLEIARAGELTEEKIRELGQ